MTLAVTAGTAGVLVRIAMKEIEVRRGAFAAGYAQALMDVPKAWWMRPFTGLLWHVSTARARMAMTQYQGAQWAALLKVRQTVDRMSDPFTVFLLGEYEVETMRAIMPDTFDALVASASKYME